jgi:hypothetical protein
VYTKVADAKDLDFAKLFDDGVPDKAKQLEDDDNSHVK